MDALNKIHDDLIRLKALGSSLVALAVSEMEVDSCQLEEIGKMVKELAEKIHDKMIGEN